MNQGKLEVVKQEMTRVNIDILGISELKWTGMGEFNSDDHYIYYCGQESFRRNGVYKDDLAQRRIQSRLGPHREAPSFITVASITEADLETWERLKVSEKTRCVVVPPNSGII